jgi:hypothetical protein
VSAAPTNGDFKRIGYMQAFWPVVVATVVVTWTLSSSLSSISDTRDRLGKLEGSYAQILSKQESADAKFNAALTELETQFRASDQERNIQWANIMRNTALLWGRVYQEKYPSEIQFYPSISRDPQIGK